MEGLIKGIQIEASRRKIEGGNEKVWTLGPFQIDDDMHFKPRVDNASAAAAD